MSIKCTSCGEKAVKNGNYFITAKNMMGQTVLLGAAGVGMCEKCIAKHSRGFLWAPMFLSILLFIFAVFCGTMIIFISGYGTVMQYVILAALTAMSLAGAVWNFVKLIKLIKRVRKPARYIKTMTPAETARIGAAIVGRKRILTENVFFSWTALAKAPQEEVDAEKLSYEFLNEIRQPFKLPMRRQLALISFHRHDLHIPFTNLPDTMNKTVRQLITKAIKG